MLVRESDGDVLVKVIDFGSSSPQSPRTPPWTA
jgi:hypothetical protein